MNYAKNSPRDQLLIKFCCQSKCGDGNQNKNRYRKQQQQQLRKQAKNLKDCGDENVCMCDGECEREL